MNISYLFPTRLMGPCHKSAAIENWEERSLSVAHATLRIFYSLEEAKADWCQAEPTSNLFLRTEYLEALESCPPRGTKFAYLVFYDHGQPAGVAYCQLIDFQAAESLRWANNGVEGWQGQLRKFIAGKSSFSFILCGNALITGTHGFYLSSPNWLGRLPQQILEEGLEQLLHCLSKAGRKMDGYFIKDPFPAGTKANTWTENGFHEFHFMPNMVLRIAPDWKSFEDYLEALSSKYRVRARRAFKKANGIRKIKLDLSGIEAFSERIDFLFQEVVNKAEFNLVAVKPGYFSALKSNLGENFQLVAYFDKEEMIGFYSTIRNGRELEAHFLGLDTAQNLEKQLYLNMLYDMIREGIALGMEKLVFARTAMEIKSSVGAKAEDLTSYIRHRNAFPNRFIHYLLQYLSPTESWQPRHPFKTSD